jgi:DMSO reductase anchor subunit
MKPAFSVIFLTTLIGAGQGLFLAYYSAELLGLLAVLPPLAITSQGPMLAGLISLGLLVAGLIASFFHLGHPERAWRAAAMWRTSWLSREVIALPLTLTLIFIYTLLKYFANQDVMIVLANGYPVQWSTAFGFFAALAVIVLFVCTAMIYACLKFLRQWHSPLTVMNFLLMGLASGFTLAAALSTRHDPQLFGYFVGFAVFLTIAAFISRLASLLRNKNLRSPTTLQSAIGVHHPTIRQIAQGAMGGSFNTRAFIHTYGVFVVKLARRFFILAAFVVPVALLVASDEASFILCGAAFVVQYLGLLVERWYFFIEAEHPQNIYYQMIS